MAIRIATERDAELWRAFVETHPQCGNYHRWPWKRVIEEAFGWPTFYLVAESDGRATGILPLVFQKSVFFGSLLCSLPFFSEAGIVTEDRETAQSLLAEAIRLATELRTQYLELRHNRLAPIDLPAKTKKVTLRCNVSNEPEEIMQRLSTKMRTNVRRAQKSGIEAEFATSEFLDDFYCVFAKKMRDLGTPVYSKRFFETILKVFPEEAFICRLRHRGMTVGVAFLTGYRQTIEANWSASLPQLLSLRPNMALFWNLLCFAGKRGYSEFDFGRSSVGSGTYSFKMQWGAKPTQLYWNYWISSGETVPELDSESPRYRAAIWVWKRLPLAVTNLVGPSIARCLP